MTTLNRPASGVVLLPPAPLAGRITASNQGRSLRLYSADVTASAQSRTLSGTLVRFGVVGRTSAGRLRVRPGALEFPDDLGTVKLTREHDRDQSRGHLTTVQASSDRIRVVCRASDGPDGDAALQEAMDRTRDGLSFDVVDAVIEGDEIVSARVIAIGQVGIPAFDDGRIESVAASQTPGSPTGTTKEKNMTAEQRARLAELRAMQSRTAEQEAELSQLATLEGQSGTDQPPAQTPETGQAQPNAPPATPAAPQQTQQVAASVPLIPAGVPGPSGISVTQRPVDGAHALRAFYDAVTAALQPGNPNRVSAITAALADITNTAHVDNIEQPAWSGELWSGLQYEPEFTPLLGSANLTNWFGAGWRFTQKLEMQDYAGDKAPIPTGNIVTESSGYEAARMAVGVDIDRKFFDFPNAAFVASLFEQVRESWAIKLDAKVLAYIVAQAVAVPGLPAQPTLLKAAARAVLALKRRRVGRASFVAVNDEDMFTLFDYAEKDVPVFLDLYNIDPKNFVSSPDIPQGQVLAGVRQTATVRTLPGSPVRVEAQNLANGGVDDAFFGYWAIEEHHTSGIAKTTFTAPAGDF